MRKMTWKSTGLLGFALCFAMLSCKKEEESPQTPSPGNTQNEEAQTFPTPSDADAVLVAVKTTSTQDTPIGPITIQLGTAVAVFSDNHFSSNEFIAAGTVSCNGSNLSSNPNQSYTFTDIGPSNLTGIDFSQDVQWEVSGANGIPSISFNADVFGFPVAQGINSSATVVKADGYTLSCSGVSGADSVLFNLGGVIKTLVGNATSCSFSAEDLSDVNAGMSIAQVAAYITNAQNIGGKKVYFINENVQSQSVTVQ